MLRTPQRPRIQTAGHPIDSSALKRRLTRRPHLSPVHAAEETEGRNRSIDDACLSRPESPPAQGLAGKPARGALREVCSLKSEVQSLKSEVFSSPKLIDAHSHRREDTAAQADLPPTARPDPPDHPRPGKQEGHRLRVRTDCAHWFRRAGEGNNPYDVSRFPASPAGRRRRPRRND